MTGIQTTGGGYEPSYKGVVVRSLQLDEYIDYINQNNVEYVYLCRLGGYALDNVDFLKQCPSIKDVNLYSSKITNVDGLYSLPELKSLTINAVGTTIDIEKLESLEQLSGSTKRIVNYNQSKSLKRLSLYDMPGERPFVDFVQMPSVVKAGFHSLRASSLSGIGVFPNLETLEISLGRKLTNIDDIQCLKKLTTLCIENCRNIADFSAIGKLSELKSLTLNEDNQMESISFIKNLKKLSSFVFYGTDVIDGDISYCEGLDYVYFTSKRHFSHKARDFEKKATPYDNIINSVRAYLEEFEDGEELPYNEETITALSKLLASYTKKEKNAYTEDEILSVSKELVLKLNKLNDSVDGQLIETDQRELICNYILSNAAMKKICKGDFTEEWRTW